MASHEILEKNSILLAVGIVLAILAGGIVEIIPLYFVSSTIEKVDGMRPYTPLELAGRDVYVREGCYTCHTQMVRPFRDEVERYGHYSLAAESMYDHPFQWGSKRTGPDLARVGGKYSDKWHVDHMINPRAIVPESVMPGYPFLKTTEVAGGLFGDSAGAAGYKDRLWANSVAFVPYTQEMIDNAEADLKAQAGAPDSDGAAALKKRYGANVNVRDFDGDPSKVTELDALIAYLQMLGTLVDFKTYNAQANLR
jgi:cytochrome c oxidase cbb3-type subunit 2